MNVCVLIPLGFITKWHRVDDINNRSLFLMVLEAGSPRLRCGWDLGLLRGCILVHNLHLLAVSSHGVAETSLRSLFYKNPIPSLKAPSL